MVVSGYMGYVNHSLRLAFALLSLFLRSFILHRMLGAPTPQLHLAIHPRLFVLHTAAARIVIIHRWIYSPLSRSRIYFHVVCPQQFMRRWARFTFECFVGLASCMYADTRRRVCRRLPRIYLPRCERQTVLIAARGNRSDRKGSSYRHRRMCNGKNISKRARGSILSEGGCSLV